MPIDHVQSLQVPVHFVVVTNEPGLQLRSKAKALVPIDRCACRCDDESAAWLQREGCRLSMPDMQQEARVQHKADAHHRSPGETEDSPRGLCSCNFCRQHCELASVLSCVGSREYSMQRLLPSSQRPQLSAAVPLADCMQQNTCSSPFFEMLSRQFRDCVDHRQAATLVVFEFAWLSVYEE